MGPRTEPFAPNGAAVLLYCRRDPATKFTSTGCSVPSLPLPVDSESLARPRSHHPSHRRRSSFSNTRGHTAAYHLARGGVEGSSFNKVANKSHRHHLRRLFRAHVFLRPKIMHRRILTPKKVQKNTNKGGDWRGQESTAPKLPGAILCRRSASGVIFL